MELKNDSENKPLKQKTKEKRVFTKWVKRHEPVFRVAEMVLIVVAFLLGIWNLWSSGKFASQVESHLKNLDTLFASVENRIEALPHSVDKFDSTIKDFTKIIKEQQQEISRKPNLKLVVERVEKIDAHKFHVFPVIVNLGNQIAQEATFILRVPRDFNFQSSGWKVWDSLSTVQVWSYRFPNMIPYESNTVKVPIGRPIGSDFSIQSTRIKEPFILRFEYTIYHDKGSQTDTLIVIYGKS